MSHATLLMWINIKVKVPPYELLESLFQLNVEQRYFATITYDYKFYMTSVTTPDPLIQELFVGDYLNKWIFMSYSCSKRTARCQVYLGELVDDPQSIQFLEKEVDENSLSMFKSLTTCTISIKTSSENTKVDSYIREIQAYQILIPLATQKLKMNIPQKVMMVDYLVILLKCDEFSGTRLYNHAKDIYSSFAFVDVADIQWVYYKDTFVIAENNQFSNPIDYLFCNKEGYTYVGDHCEYYQCHLDCNNTGNIG